MNDTDRDRQCHGKDVSCRNQAVFAGILYLTFLFIIAVLEFFKIHALDQIYIELVLPLPWLIFGCVFSAIELTAATYVFKRLHFGAGILPPGHRILLAEVPVIALTCVGSVVLIKWANSIDIALNVDTVETVACSVISGLCFAIAVAYRGLGLAWIVFFIFHASLSFVVAGSILFSFGHLEIIMMSCGGAYIGCAIMAVAVTTDLLMRVRRDFLHYIGVGYLAAIYISTIVGYFSLSE